MCYQLGINYIIFYLIYTQPAKEYKKNIYEWVMTQYFAIYGNNYCVFNHLIFLRVNMKNMLANIILYVYYCAKNVTRKARILIKLW